MGTVVEKLDYLNETKELIKEAIIVKGQKVSDSDPFRSYADKIRSISGGGGEVNNQDKTINENGEYTADEGYSGLGTVTVDIGHKLLAYVPTDCTSVTTAGTKVFLNDINWYNKQFSNYDTTITNNYGFICVGKKNAYFYGTDTYTYDYIKIRDTETNEFTDYTTPAYFGSRMYTYYPINLNDVFVFHTLNTVSSYKACYVISNGEGGLSHYTNLASYLSSGVGSNYYNVDGAYCIPVRSKSLLQVDDSIYFTNDNYNNSQSNLYYINTKTNSYGTVCSNVTYSGMALGISYNEETETFTVLFANGNTLSQKWYKKDGTAGTYESSLSELNGKKTFCQTNKMFTATNGDKYVYSFVMTNSGFRVFYSINGGMFMEDTVTAELIFNTIGVPLENFADYSIILQPQVDGSLYVNLNYKTQNNSNSLFRSDLLGFRFNKDTLLYEACQHPCASLLPATHYYTAGYVNIDAGIATLKYGTSNSYSATSYFNYLELQERPDFGDLEWVVVEAKSSNFTPKSMSALCTDVHGTDELGNNYVQVNIDAIPEYAPLTQFYSQELLSNNKALRSDNFQWYTRTAESTTYKLLENEYNDARCIEKVDRFSSNDVGYNIIGSDVTVVGGIASNFSASSWIKFTLDLPQDDILNYYVEFYYPNTTYFCSILCPYGDFGSAFCVEVNASGNLDMYNYSAGTAQTYSLTKTKTYQVKVTINYTTQTKTYYIREKGQSDYTLITSMVDTNIIKTPTFAFSLGNHPNRTSRYNRGTISLNNTYITDSNNNVVARFYSPENFTAVGSPTISGGIVSGFSTSNYLKIPTFSPLNDPWEISFEFKTGSDITTWQQLFHSCVGTGSAGRYGISMSYRDGKMEFDTTTDGTSWAFTKKSDLSITANTRYFIKFGWDGTTYYCDLSTDSVNYTNYISVENSVGSPAYSYTYIGIYSTDSMKQPPLSKTYINLNTFTIKQNGVVVYTPYVSTEHEVQIEYKETPSGYTIADAYQSDKIQNIYSEGKYAHYSVIDEENEKFMLPALPPMENAPYQYTYKK